MTTELHKALKEAAGAHSITPALARAFKLLAEHFDPDFEVKPAIDQPTVRTLTLNPPLAEGEELNITIRPPKDAPTEEEPFDPPHGEWMAVFLNQCGWRVRRPGHAEILVSFGTVEAGETHLELDLVSHALANALNREATE